MSITNKKIRQGVVVSDKMEKTRVIVVERTTQHPLYKKTIRLTKKYKMHDENNETREGDVVSIIETRPISKDKKWRLLKIVKKAI